MADQQPPASQPPSEPPQHLGGSVDQASIDELLRQSGFPQPDDSADPAPPASDAPGGSDAGQLADQASIDELLRQASFEDPSSMSFAAGSMVAPDASEFKLPNFQQVMQDAQASSIDLLRDVELNVKIELGRARMLVEDVLKLVEGSVVELDKLAGDPVDVFVNDRLVARGEVLVLNDNFCVRVNEIVSGVKDEGA
jgi:flagellar motor switch protein FliN/FliY